MLRIRSRRVWIANGFRPAELWVNDAGKIEKVLMGEQAFAESAADTAANVSGVFYEAELTDYGNLRIVPGFIDVHTHGAYGYDTNDAEKEGLRMWMRRIPEEGVTGILPTTVTQMPDILKRAAASVAAVAEEGYEGAEILGIHFEGPYFDMAYKGAQPPEAIKEASVEEFKAFQEAAKGLIKYISLAPEHDPDLALTRYCSSHGVVVSVGHSNADFACALNAVANGATSETHVCNAMTPLKHREPGLVGAAMRIRDIYGEMICDTMHVSPEVVNIYFKTKGPDFVIMVSDSLRCKNADPDQVFTLGGHRVTLDENGLGRLEDGTIAGSTMRMNEGLRNLAETCMVPFDYALNACTINPARCLGVDDRKGKLCAGYDADIVVLEEDYSVRQTYCRGKAQM